MYRLATLVDPFYESVKSTPLADIFGVLTLDDLAMWYLDDGCLLKRRDSNSYRYVLCVGNIEGADAPLLDAVRRCTGLTNVGTVRKNNSKATERNLVVKLTVPAGEIIANAARKYAPESLQRKLPS